MSKETHSTKKVIATTITPTSVLESGNLEQEDQMAKQTNCANDLCSLNIKSLDGEAVDYEQFAATANKACLNSTFVAENGIIINVVESEQDLCAVNERKHNLARSLSTISELDAELIGDKSVQAFTISPKPASSSKGFENTFSLLQKQVANGNVKSKTLKQTLAVANESISKSFQIEQSVTRFELELLARERLHTLWHEVHSSSTDNSEEMAEASLLSFLYDFSVNNEEVDESKYRGFKLQSEHYELKYYASLDADGKKCLRAVRNPNTLHVKGMSITFPKTKSLFSLFTNIHNA